MSDTKVCASCKYQRGKDIFGQKLCKQNSNATLSVIDGKIRYYDKTCVDMRSHGPCKMEGKFWEPKDSIWIRIAQWMKGK